MYINITIDALGRQNDIRIDSEQKIAAAFEVLQEAGKLPAVKFCPDYFRSRLNQVQVSTYKTFAEEQIFDGDILTAVE